MNSLICLDTQTTRSPGGGSAIACDANANAATASRHVDVRLKPLNILLRCVAQLDEEGPAGPWCCTAARTCRIDVIAPVKKVGESRLELPRMVRNRDREIEDGVTRKETGVGRIAVFVIAILHAGR